MLLRPPAEEAPVVEQGFIYGLLGLDEEGLELGLEELLELE